MQPDRGPVCNYCRHCTLNTFDYRLCPHLKASTAQPKYPAQRSTLSGSPSRSAGSSTCRRAGHTCNQHLGEAQQSGRSGSAKA